MNKLITKNAIEKIRFIGLLLVSFPVSVVFIWLSGKAIEATLGSLGDIWFKTSIGLVITILGGILLWITY